MVTKQPQDYSAILVCILALLVLSQKTNQRLDFSSAGAELLLVALAGIYNIIKSAEAPPLPPQYGMCSLELANVSSDG